MPSLITTHASGAPFPIASGNVFSGQGANVPYAGIELKADISNSGAIYVSYSGGVNVTSGGFLLSGISNDGFAIFPGQTHYVPRRYLVSGQVNIFAASSPAGSGRDRLYWEPK